MGFDELVEQLLYDVALSGTQGMSDESTACRLHCTNNLSSNRERQVEEKIVQE